jgi:hypothetical protein
VVVPVVVAVLLFLATRFDFGRGGVSRGSALDSEGGGGILQPLPANTPLALGIVQIENESDDPIELESARLLRLDPDLELLGFGVLPMGPGPYGSNPPITWMEYPLPGQVPLAEYPPVPPAQDDDPQAAVMFGLRVKPQGAGKAVGIEVTYRQKGKLRKQEFEEQVYVCWVPSLSDGSDCPGPKRPFDFFGDYEDEVKGISQYPPLSKK